MKHSELAFAAHSKIALLLGCEKEIVDLVFDWLPSPYASNLETVKRRKQEGKALLEISAIANPLANKVDANGGATLGEALRSSEISVSRLRKLSIELARSGDIPSKAPIMRSSKGGKNWASYDIAHGIAQIYKKLGRTITFGHDNGVPTTEFGRAVCGALEAFSVQSNWREPARQASVEAKLEGEN